VQQPFRIYGSSVSKKVAMAASGVILVLWIGAHMLGNLKAFLGPESINSYAEGLRTFGEPFLPHGSLLWMVRAGLLFSVGIHILAATQLTLQSRAARPVAYRHTPHMETSYASRTMRWGGVIILLYVIYHLFHMTLGTAHPAFVPGDVYLNLVTGFQAWPVVLAYVIATLALAMHLQHGIWSALQTVGASHPRVERLRRAGAAAIAVAVFAGFVSVPLAVLLGVLA
jgi:succinate dehydrogenase / fumarate reductase cytochrome b subunit